eukprot:TRINITY_DN1509_c0_g1_i7.p2 TRINITY_DN1509_c0_g1~~TRINITY_DN1509_c0_g1_i7.p2  ORF type:complete len:102 (-),score=6.38 TRINITY_DN1509_c0_g1_i7:222-527(-)
MKQDNSYRFNQDVIPRGRGQYIKTGIKIPAPCGADWRRRVKAKGEGLKAVEALTNHWNEQHTIEANAARKVKKARRKANNETGAPEPPFQSAFRERAFWDG